MTRTFLVALDLEPMSDIDSIAADMLDSLSQDGFRATSVKPWASANTDQQTGDFWNLSPTQTFSGPPVL
jgi:hypothetical protein